MVYGAGDGSHFQVRRLSFSLIFLPPSLPPELNYEWCVTSTGTHHVATTWGR